MIEPETSDSTTGSDASASITSTTMATAASSTSAIDESDADTRGATTVPFLVEPDVSGSTLECDFFAQDCRPGEKCTLWASDGGTSVNATKCVPVVDDPAGVGEPCQMQEPPLSGFDDCDFGAYCWYIDPKTLEGVCLAFCVGDESNPYCEEPYAECWSCGESCPPLCLPMCSPLAQDCPPGQACYPIQDAWDCAPDASGDQGGYGDPCEYINACDPGLVCLDSDAVPPGQACEGAIGCCSEICDITDPAGDLQCAGAGGGQTCQPWYEEGAAPRGYENVGVCALP